MRAREKAARLRRLRFLRGGDNSLAVGDRRGPILLRAARRREPIEALEQNDIVLLRAIGAPLERVCCGGEFGERERVVTAIARELGEVEVSVRVVRALLALRSDPRHLILRVLRGLVAERVERGRIGLLRRIPP